MAALIPKVVVAVVVGRVVASFVSPPASVVVPARRCRCLAKRYYPPDNNNNRRTTRERGAATHLRPSTLVIGEQGKKIVEDHRHEQFWFDPATADRVARIALRYSRPLLIGLPSVAAVLQRLGRDYVLLDRDLRLEEAFPAGKFKRFDLHRPEAVAPKGHDVIFADPPFANVSPGEFAAAIRTLSGGETTPLYVCYPIKRRHALAESLGCDLDRHDALPLSYATGLMAHRIALYRGEYHAK